MQNETHSVDEALMERLLAAICDESISPTSRQGQVEGIARMLSEAPGRPGGPPPHSDDYQR
jgi:hypothetical protein